MGQIDIDGVKVLLANKVYTLPSAFGGENPEAWSALEPIFSDASKDEISLFIVSDSRSCEK